MRKGQQIESVSERMKKFNMVYRRMRYKNLNARTKWRKPR